MHCEDSFVLIWLFVKYDNTLQALTRSLQALTHSPAQRGIFVLFLALPRRRCDFSYYCSGGYLMGATCVNGFCECTGKGYNKYTCLRKSVIAWYLYLSVKWKHQSRIVVHHDKNTSVYVIGKHACLLALCKITYLLLSISLHIIRQEHQCWLIYTNSAGWRRNIS